MQAPYCMGLTCHTDARTMKYIKYFFALYFMKLLQNILTFIVFIALKAYLFPTTAHDSFQYFFYAYLIFLAVYIVFGGSTWLLFFCTLLYLSSTKSISRERIILLSLALIFIEALILGEFRALAGEQGLVNVLTTLLVVIINLIAGILYGAGAYSLYQKMQASLKQAEI